MNAIQQLAAVFALGVALAPLPLIGQDSGSTDTESNSDATDDSADVDPFGPTDSGTTRQRAHDAPGGAGELGRQPGTTGERAGDQPAGAGGVGELETESGTTGERAFDDPLEDTSDDPADDALDLEEDELQREWEENLQ